MVPMHHGWLWFPNQPGLISGIIIGGFGFGALVFAPLATAIVNPDGEQAVNGKFSPSVNERVQKMLIVLNICFLAVCIISGLLIFPGRDPTAFTEVIDKLEYPHLATIEEERDNALP